MGGFGIWHWLIVIILVMLLFGKGRVSDMMGDLGKGLKSFKQGMAEEDDKPGQPRPTNDPRALPPQQPYQQQQQPYQPQPYQAEPIDITPHPQPTQPTQHQPVDPRPVDPTPPPPRDDTAR